MTLSVTNSASEIALCRLPLGEVLISDCSLKRAVVRTVSVGDGGSVQVRLNRSVEDAARMKIAPEAEVESSSSETEAESKQKEEKESV